MGTSTTKKLLLSIIEVQLIPGVSVSEIAVTELASPSPSPYLRVEVAQLKIIAALLSTIEAQLIIPIRPLNLEWGWGTGEAFPWNGRKM